ncbi:hypothetical protein T439DRAFT_332887 [Meredithblackwellia eburnea MCA 4105]
MVSPVPAARLQPKGFEELKDIHLEYMYDNGWKYELWVKNHERIVYAIHGGPMKGRRNYQTWLSFSSSGSSNLLVRNVGEGRMMHDGTILMFWSIVRVPRADHSHERISQLLPESSRRNLASFVGGGDWYCGYYHD